jgi:uncharacterized protein (DUF608 family)
VFSWDRIGPKARRFTGEALRTIAFPFGGIGTGTLSLGGRGNLRDWEIFNRPAKGRHLPYTFFSIWAQRAGERAVARVLERRILPPYESGFGLPTGLVSGLPRLDEASFNGAYPLARIDFIDDRLPVRVTLEAFNPFIPMNDRDSGIPCAVFVWTVENTAAAPVDLTLCLSMLNACGLDGTTMPDNRHHAQLGRNLNRYVEERGLHGIVMDTDKYEANHPQYGSMSMAVLADEVTYLTRWERAGWWDDVQSFWDDFAGDGLLPNSPEPEPSPDGQSDVGSLGARLHLEPSASVSVPFIIAWRFPNLYNYWNSEEAVRGKRLGNWYATQWPHAWDAVRYVAREFPRLAAETDAFASAFFDSTLPSEVLDAVSANMSTMRTTTCVRTEDGRFHGFEGCHDNGGCCPMNCTHVWNYEQSVAFLFPQLERTMRETDFCHNTRPNGNMAFRTLLPLVGQLWDFKPAADGQMGTILKVYREWLQCGDREFLDRMWPGIERALEYVWQAGSWDGDRDGVMEGEQHNTYDIEFYGPNTMTGALYLGALRAAEEMARYLGHDELAERYRSVADAGARKYVKLLWNGSYFEQIVLKPGTGLDSGPLTPDSPDYPRYQFGKGCLSDHMLGQWFARVVGLGAILPEEAVQSAVRSIYEYNYRRDLREHQSVQRVYALNEEPGLLLCTWPRGGRPAYPFPYADEVWTGIEYQVAAHLIYEGYVAEGLEIVRGVRSRHDGFKRNPWNEPECGHHYARAMSSWSLLLALSGYHYNAAQGLLHLNPVLCDMDFRAFFTVGSAWGVASVQHRGGRCVFSATVLWGNVTVQTLDLPMLDPAACDVRLNGGPVAVHAVEGCTRFVTPVRLTKGDVLVVDAATAMDS